MGNLSSESQSGPTATQEEEEEEESFGTISTKYSSWRLFRKSTAQLYNLRLREQSVEDEERELEPKSWQGRRNTPYWYFFQCKHLIKEGKLAEALDLFERQMLKEERLRPLECNYTVLIGGCGRAGYLKKAFRLYNDVSVGVGRGSKEHWLWDQKEWGADPEMSPASVFPWADDLTSSVSVSSSLKWR